MAIFLVWWNTVGVFVSCVLTSSLAHSQQKSKLPRIIEAAKRERQLSLYGAFSGGLQATTEERRSFWIDFAKVPVYRDQVHPYLGDSMNLREFPLSVPRFLPLNAAAPKNVSDG